MPSLQLMPRPLPGSSLLGAAPAHQGRNSCREGCAGGCVCEEAKRLQRPTAGSNQKQVSPGPTQGLAPGDQKASVLSPSLGAVPLLFAFLLRVSSGREASPLLVMIQLSRHQSWQTQPWESSRGAPYPPQKSPASCIKCVFYFRIPMLCCLGSAGPEGLALRLASSQ